MIGRIQAESLRCMYFSVAMTVRLTYLEDEASQVGGHLQLK